MNRLPVPVTLAALVALYALFVTAGGGLIPLPVLGVLLLASYAIPFRIPERSLGRWVARIALGTFVYQLSADPPAGEYLIGPAAFRNLFGQLWAVEIVVHAWRQSRDRASLGLPILLLSGLVFLSAGNTFNEQYIRLIAPVYVLFVALSLRGYRSREPAAGPLAQRIGQQLPWLTLLIVALAIGAALFGTFWRFRGDLAAAFGSVLQRRQGEQAGTGMASQPQLGPTFGLRGSDARVLRVENFNGASHLRGLSFDAYAGDGRWGPRVDERVFAPTNPVALRTGQRVSGGELMRITRLVDSNPLLYAPLGTVALDPGDVGVADDLEWARSSGGPLRTEEDAPYPYTITIVEEPARGFFAGTLSPVQRARGLQLPPGLDARVPRLAARVAGPSQSPAARADAVVAYLIRTHPYSLTTDPGPGDPVTGFLLAEGKGAHCEYFAASAAVLLRCLNIPSRYVSGYLGHEGAGDGTLVVRQHDAHAWTEAWIEGRGWVTLDATPGSGRPDQMAQAPLPLWQRAWEQVQDWIQAARDWVAGLTPLQTALTLAGGSVLAALPFAWSFLRRRAAGAQRTSALFAYASPPNAQLALLGARFAALLARRNGPVPPGVTWREWRDGAGNENDFITLYNRARFGGRIDNETLARLRGLLEQLEAEPSPSPAKDQ